MSQKYQREHHAVLRIRISSTLFECCGYIRSGSSYEFLEFRILPIVFKHIWKLNYIKKHFVTAYGRRSWDHEFLKSNDYLYFCPWHIFTQSSLADWYIRYIIPVTLFFLTLHCNCNWSAISFLLVPGPQHCFICTYCILIGARSRICRGSVHSTWIFASFLGLDPGAASPGR